MREFKEGNGASWTAAVDARPGSDYKGRFHLVFRPLGGGEPVKLTEIQWNSERSAERTLATMSMVELRRRLRSARGRSAAAAG